MIPQPIDAVPLFQRLSEEERQLVTARLKRRQAAPGELIVSEGQTANTMFVISSGWVKLEGGPQHSNVTLANMGAGSLLGEVDMLLGRPYSMTARAAGATSTQLLTLTRSDLESLVNQRPSIALKFSASMGVRISFLQEYLVRQRLRNIELLSALPDSDLRAIAQRLDFRAVSRGDIIFEAGTPGDAAFLIEEGSVRLITKSGDGEAFEDLKESTVFGHTALLTGRAHASTARAVTDVTLWVLTRQVYQELIREHPAVKLAFSRALAESLSQRDQSDAVERMRQLHLFSDVATDTLSTLAARLVLRHFPAEEAIYTEGTSGDAMYIVDSGEVRLLDSAFSDAVLLERIRPGEAFGEMALLTGRTRAECARAASDTTVWVLYKSDFDELMVQYPEISLSLSRALTQRLTSRESDFVIRHLRRIDLFSNLASSELKEISKRVRGLRFRAGEIVCFAGEPAQTLFLIEKGEVKRMATGPSGEPITIDVLDTGDSFGEQDIVQNNVYSTTAQAITEVELWTVGKSDFLAMLEEYPSLAITVTRKMADRLSRVQRAQGSAQSRPRGGAPVQPRPPVARPAANVPPPQRVQRPPSGARPIKPTATMGSTAQHTSNVAQATGTARPNPSPRPTAPQLPHFQPPQLPHLQVPHLQPPHLPHLQAPHLPHRAPPPPPETNAIPRRARRRENAFFKEFGEWASGLSVGAKLRVLTLGLLATWFALVAGPWMTITTVTSTVGGLQLSNAPDQVSSRSGNSASAIGSNPFSGGGSKVALAVPTNTPVPTRTPQPTFTPRPQPTRVAATRAPVVAVAPTAAAPAIPALPPPEVDPRLGNGPQVLPLLDKVKIIPVSVAHGAKYWRVTKLKFENIEESGSDHSIYVKIYDEAGKRTEAKLKLWGEGSGDLPDPEQKKVDDMCNCNYGIGMWGDGYGVKIVDQYPSDSVVGMIMPMRRHVNYRVTYQLVTNP